MKRLVSAEKGKGICWGLMPFSQGLEPLLADINPASDTYGILFRSKVCPNVYVIGKAGVIYSFPTQTAEELLEEYQKTK